MKTIINQPMKSILLKAVLCGAFSLSAASQWNVAQAAGIVEEPKGGKGGRGPAPKVHNKQAAPKVPEHPKEVARHESPERRRMPKGAPHEAPHEGPKVASFHEGPHEAAKIAAMHETPKVGGLHEAPKFAGWRRPIPLRNLEAVARLRRELFAHRWSFVYAASLKHAPKSLRFLQNGIVETEVKGERWFWEPLEGRRISLRTLADETQPAVTLEFDEGFTNFRYVLPNQTVAVQGAPLDAIAEAPASSVANGRPTTLEEALLTYPWNWADAAGKSDADIRFERNKSFRLAGRTSFWNVTGPRTVHIEFENGDQTDLLFDGTFSVFTDGNQISGFRETPEANTAATASDIKL